jgi:glycosyltransferase involved in cell wall biosynthesis
MVIVSERVSEWIDKGEIIDRYYNPGDIFAAVDIVLTNDDRPDGDSLQRLVGTAQLKVFNLPTPTRHFYRTVGWRPALLRSWARGAVSLASSRRPALVRCYGAHLNAFAAAEIKRALGTPFVVSLHGNPDHDLRRHPRGPSNTEPFRVRAQHWALLGIERHALRSADSVLCVYRFIEPYARGIGAPRVDVIYNVVAPTHIRPKSSYELGSPPSVIVPGRQLDRKDPMPVVEALAKLDGVRGVFVGRGPRHDDLKARAAQLGIAERCDFVPAMANDELVSGLGAHDVLISVNDYGGVSKVEIEAALTGMPIITNSHPMESSPELLDEHCIAVSGDTPSYVQGLRRLLSNRRLREDLGTAVRRSAEQQVHPNVTEPAHARLHAELAGLS